MACAWSARAPPRPAPPLAQDYEKPGSQAEPGSFLGFETAFKGTGEPQYPGGERPLLLPAGSGGQIAGRYPGKGGIGTRRARHSG